MLRVILGVVCDVVQLLHDRLLDVFSLKVIHISVPAIIAIIEILIMTVFFMKI